MVKNKCKNIYLYEPASAQVFPSYPARHAHINVFMESIQVAPFLQGYGVQSSIFTSQRDPKTEEKEKKR